MLWKVGGNFETVAITCETNWKECLIAIANYLWREVVSDVVDYLAKEGIIWVIAVAIASTMFIRIKYCKNIYTKNIVFNERILNKVGYKIQDLELKINVLTYKMQYGTWPLPHQIYNLNPKLQKIKTTLSDPGDQKNWIKHVLLNPSLESNMCAPYLKTHHSLIKLTKPFEIKRECAPHVKRSELSTKCSSIESLKSTSDQSINSYSWKSNTMESQNVKSTKENDLSKSENFTLQRQNMQLLPLNPDGINHQSSKMTLPSIQDAANATYSTNAKCSPCQKFTDTIYKCKSFLKKLQHNDKYLHSLNHSPKTSEASLKTVHTTKQTIKNPKGMNRQVTSNDTVILKTNKGASSKENVSVLPLMQPTHNVRSSQETLYEVKRRLQSLHNVLQTYQDMNQSLKRQVPAGRVNGNDASVELDTNHDINTKKNVQTQCPSVDSCEYFDLDQSEESLSSLAKYSSTSKVCQCSSENVISQTCSKDLSRHNIRKSRNNLPALGTTEPYLRSCNAALNMSNDYENEYKKIAYERNNSDCSHELESGPKINKNIIKIDTLLKIQDNISETVSDKIYYILSPENKNIQTQNRTSPRFVSEKFNDIIDKNEYQENAIISQNSSQSKTSNDSNNKEEKSTALLLQEALHFKNALLIQSKKKYPINNVKQNDTADEFLSEPNNNFPSMIVDIKAEKPIINSSHDKIDEHYIYLQMKQRCDLSSQSLKKLDTFAHCENERDMKNQNHIPETSSEYFSITDFAIHGNAEIENNVSSNPPIYEKVISITLPVDVKDQGEINNINEKSKQTILPNTQTRVNLRENFRDDAASDNDVNKHSPAMLKLEDLIIERIKNIRDYMDDFLQSQNIAIFKARKALRYKSDNSRCSAEVSRKVTRDRLTVPFSCKNNDPMVFSKNSSDSLTNTQPNYKQEYDQETDAVLKRPSDVYLKRNPGMLALITPIKNKFSKNDERQLKVFTELKKADKSPPITLIHSTHKNDSKPAHKITNVFTPCYEGHAMQNTESDEINKVIIAENSVNMDFHKEKQIQINENKSSAMSYFPVSITKTNAKVVHTANEEYVTKSNYNSICHSNPYFTNEKKGCENNKGGENGSCIFEVIKDVKMDYVSLKSTTNIQNEVKQDAIKQQITEDKYPNANITSNKLPSDIEYSNMTIFIDSDLIFNKSKPDYLTNAKTASPLTKLKEDDITFDPDASLLSFSSEKQDKTLNIDNVSLNSLKQNKISADIEHLPSRMEDYSTKSFQTDSEMKAKSDISLITSRNKDLNINLYSKKSHSFLMHHDTMKYIDDISPQSHTKLYDIKSKLQFTSQSKSIIPLQRVSTKSCIPILKNRLESSHRMKHRAQARSPARSSTRSPLTMLWGEKTCTKDHTTDEEVARRGNTSINKHLCAEEMLNLIKLNTKQDTKELEKSNTTCRNNDIIPKENLQILPDRNIESLAINEKYSNKKRDIYESKSDTNIMQHIEKIASKEIAVISIIANDSLQQKYPVNLFILNTENICPATDFLIYKNKLWTINVKKTKKEVTEKEVMAKPSITDTCTSISDLK